MAIRQEGNTYYGLSTDTKPTGAVLNGREFREMDTGKKYLFDAENGEWLEQPEEGGGGGGGSSTLSGLTDVDISNPTDGQTLVYNATSGKWENGAGGGGGVMVIHDVNGTLDKTWQEIVNALSTQSVVMFSATEYDSATVTEVYRVFYYVENPAIPVYVISIETAGDYVTDTPNGYPVSGDN